MLECICTLTHSSNSDGNKWSSSEHGSNSIAAAMSMAVKGTHYFPCTLARHNFCIFFVSSIQRFHENIIAVSSKRSLVLTQYNKVLGVPDLFEVPGFVDRIFWSVLPGYPGAVKVGERTKSHSCVVTDCLLCYCASIFI